MDEQIRKLTSPDQILAAALEKEQAAHRFYSELLGHSKVDMVRELVAQLKDEEYKHMRLIERKIADLGMGRG